MYRINNPDEDLDYQMKHRYDINEIFLNSEPTKREFKRKYVPKSYNFRVNIFKYLIFFRKLRSIHKIQEHIILTIMPLIKKKGLQKFFLYLRSKEKFQKKKNLVINCP